MTIKKQVNLEELNEMKQKRIVLKQNQIDQLVAIAKLEILGIPRANATTKTLMFMSHQNGERDGRVMLAREICTILGLDYGTT